LPVQRVDAYLYEPDAAVLRAGLVRTLGHRLAAAQLHPEIAFLTADAIRPTPFAKIFKVEEVIRFGLKRIRKVLNARNVGRVTIKKRGSAIDVAQFTRQLRLKGDQEAILILTRMMDERVAILVTPLEHNSEDSAHKR